MYRKHKLTIIVSSSLAILALVIFVTSLVHNPFKADENNTIPAAPTNLIATDNSDKTQILLQWSDNTSNEVGFKIERSPDILNGEFTQIAQVGTNITNYTDSNIVKGNRYWYKIKLYNSSCESDYSNITTPTRQETENPFINIGKFENESLVPGIAAGWYKNLWGRGNNSNTEFRLDEEEGASGSKAQYIGFKGPVAAEVALVGQYSRSLPVDDTSNTRVHHGDNLTINLNKYYMTESKPGSIYMVQVNTRAADGTPLRTREYALTKTVKDSPLVFTTAGGNDYTIESDEYSIAIAIYIRTNVGFLAGETAGITIDDMEVFFKRSGSEQYNSIQVPTPRERNINTQRVFFDPSQDDTYENAKNYDCVSGGFDTYYLMIELRYYNPNIKLLGYTASTFHDARKTDYSDPTNSYSYTPIPFAWALDHQKDLPADDQWFFKYPANTAVIESVGDKRAAIAPGSTRLFKNDGTTPLDYVFFDQYQDRYPANLSSPSYRDSWVDHIVANYSKYKFDGMFLDDTAPTTVNGTRTDPGTGAKTTVNVVSINTAQIQEFVSYVVPKIHEDLPQFDIVQNSASQHYDDKIPGIYGWPGKTYLNPIWDPASETAGQNGAPADFNAENYLKNTFATTSNTFFNEFAYLNLDWNEGDMSNRYYFHNWIMSIDDIDKVALFNSQIADERMKKRLFQSLVLMDRPDKNNFIHKIDETVGYDTGWAPFILVSYLLNNNNYSYLGIYQGNGLDKSYENPIMTDPGWEKTKKLGDAITARKIVYENVEYSFSDSFLDSDAKKSIQYRNFQNGLIVVNGSPDQTLTFDLNKDMYDDNGVVVSSGNLAMLPHTGRIFFTKIDSPVIVPPVTTITPTPITSPATTLSLPTDRFSTGWNMSSFPDLTSITNNALGLTTGNGFKLRSYNRTSNNYDKGDDGNMSLTPGKGYWLKVSDINKINGLNYPLNQVSFTETSVTKGWNLLGNPYQSDLPLSNLSVKYKDGTVRSYADAITRKEVAGYAWSYEGSEKKYYFIAISPDKYKTSSPKNTVIKPYRGFWMIVKSDAVSGIIYNR